MKVRITFKDPDGVNDSIFDAVTQSLEDITGISKQEVAILRETREEIVREQIKNWIKYSEYVTIEIDTDENTAVVIPNK